MICEDEIADIEHKDLWLKFWNDRDSSDAMADLVNAWMPLVNSILDRIAIQLPAHVQVDDLFQSAVIGLFGAIERFDVKNGAGFKSFAYRRIKGAILDELRSNDHVPRARRAKLKKLERSMQLLTNKLGAPPDEEALAKEMDVSVEDVRELIDSAHPLLSLDQVIIANKGGKEIFLKDVLADPDSPSPDEQAVKEDMRTSLRKSFRCLSVREQKILHLYYFEDLRLSEIAALFEVTEARICQIHGLAIAKMQALMYNIDAYGG